MDDIVGIKIGKNNKIIYFYTNKLKIKKNMNVIVDIDNTLRFGTIETEIHHIYSSKLKTKLGKIVRIASKQDYHTAEKNERDSEKALKKCIELAKEYKLDIKILDAYYTHDREQLIFRFVSDTRVDFRNLARDLANIYHTRIELRQIGVRDKAKEVGGIGSCGQKLCCARFLNDFDSVSISMAKNQNLALNPTKINGLCGRLLCCLKYENDCYKECRKKLPKIGETIKMDNNEEGKVVSVDILNEKYEVETQKGKIEINLNGSN